MDTQIDSSGDNSKDLGTAIIREVGCGVVYTIEFEDTDETHCQVGLDRAAAERLYTILGKMLEKTTLPNPVPIQQPNWLQNPCTQIPPPWQWPRF